MNRKLAEMSKPLEIFLNERPSKVSATKIPISKNLARIHNMYQRRLQSNWGQTGPGSTVSLGGSKRRDRIVAGPADFFKKREPRVRFEDIINIDIDFQPERNFRHRGSGSKVKFVE